MMNRVDRSDCDLSWEQSSVFDVNPCDRSKWAVIGPELAWRVADVENIRHVQITQFGKACTRSKPSNEDVLRNEEQS